VSSGFSSGAHGKHRRAFAASKSLTVPNTSNYFVILCLQHDDLPDLSMLHQFGGSDVHLSSPAIIALVHNASYLEVPLYFCSRALFLHPFRVDFIPTRIDTFYLLPLSFWKPKSKVDSMATAVTFMRCTDTSTRPSFPRNHSWMPAKATTVDETCLERTISTLRRIAVPLDCIMK
jgi:hypothetical protein